MKSRLISKGNLKFLNDFLLSLQWITLEFWRGCEYCYIEWTSCRWKGIDCLCKDLIPLLLIRCFHKIAIRQDQHQCCTFICGALICSSVKIVSLLLRRVWHSEFGPPWQSSLSCFSKFSHTFICTIAAKVTSFFPLHQKDLFIKSSPLPQFQWQQTIFHFPPSVGFVFVLNPAKCATSVDLLPLVFHCFSKRIFSLWVEFYFLCCIIVQSWLIISSNAIFITMKIFTVWILACVIPASCYFFDECLEEISVGLLWQKRK